MTSEELKQIGYIKKSYGSNKDDNRFQCFNCKYGTTSEENREKVICNKWKIVTEEDDRCNAFELSNYCAFHMMEEDENRRNKKLEEYKAARSEECYIATVVYGGYDKPEVMVLRRYRDEVLKKSVLGRLFIKAYYKFSPFAVERLKNNRFINQKVKMILDKIIEKM